MSISSRPLWKLTHAHMVCLFSKTSGKLKEGVLFFSLTICLLKVNCVGPTKMPSVVVTHLAKFKTFGNICLLKQDRWLAVERAHAITLLRTLGPLLTPGSAGKRGKYRSSTHFYEVKSIRSWFNVPIKLLSIWESLESTRTLKVFRISPWPTHTQHSSNSNKSKLLLAIDFLIRHVKIKPTLFAFIENEFRSTVLVRSKTLSSSPHLWPL